MGRQTTLWLCLLVLAIALAAWWQLGRERDEGLGTFDAALLEGLRRERVAAIHIDHLERGTFHFERDSRGAWYLTDPISYPADEGVVTVLLDVASQSRATAVARVERDAQELGFDPPRAVVTFEERVGEGGGERIVEHRVELGFLDLDGQRVNVRRDGRFLRTTRKLHTTIDRSLNDYRSRRVLDLDPRRVAAVDRSGSVQFELEGAPIPLDLHAIADGNRWRSLLPEAELDPLDISLVTVGSAAILVDRFVDDRAGTLEALEEYGLAQPEFQVELHTYAGVSEVLGFGRKKPGGAWFLHRAGWPYVWGVTEEDVLRVTIPFEGLLDRRFARVARQAVEALVLRSPAGELRVARAGGSGGGAEAWTVAADGAAPVPASTARVEEVLSRLELMELAGFLLDRVGPTPELRCEVRLEAGGRALGGRLGADETDAEGRPALLFQRLGDEVLALCDPWLRELCESPLVSWRSLELLTVAEIDLVGLELTLGAEERRFVRSERGRWTPAGEEREALELLPALDPLLFLRAREHLAQPGEALEDPIEVRLELRDGSARTLVVGRRAGRTLCELEGRRAVLQIEDLHARLRAAFEE